MAWQALTRILPRALDNRMGTLDTRLRVVNSRLAVNTSSSSLDGPNPSQFNRHLNLPDRNNHLNGFHRATIPHLLARRHLRPNHRHRIPPTRLPPRPNIFQNVLSFSKPECNRLPRILRPSTSRDHSRDPLKNRSRHLDPPTVHQPTSRLPRRLPTRLPKSSHSLPARPPRPPQHPHRTVLHRNGRLPRSPGPELLLMWPLRCLPVSAGMPPLLLEMPHQSSRPSAHMSGVGKTAVPPRRTDNGRNPDNGQHPRPLRPEAESTGPHELDGPSARRPGGLRSGQESGCESACPRSPDRRLRESQAGDANRLPGPGGSGLHAGHGLHELRPCRVPRRLRTGAPTLHGGGPRPHADRRERCGRVGYFVPGLLGEGQEWRRGALLERAVHG